MIADAASPAREVRPRRSNLAVPGSNVRMLEKAKGLGADQVFLDLEDACAPAAKQAARRNIVSALTEGGWGRSLRAVRVNDWTTEWTYRDVVEVVEGAGAHLDAVILPKVTGAAQLVALDLLITQIETATGLAAGRIGIEVQIEDARGLLAADAIAAASPRVETLIFGPADFMAGIAMKSLVVGEQPPGYDVGDAYHHILMSILLAARANGKQAIDGPYPQIGDLDGFRRLAARPRSGSTASGSCTRARWDRPTKCSVPGRPTTTTRRTSRMPTAGTRLRRAAPAAR